MNWFLEKVDEDIFIKSGEDSVEEINNIQAGGYGKVEVTLKNGRKLVKALSDFESDRTTFSVHFRDVTNSRTEFLAQWRKLSFNQAHVQEAEPEKKTVNGIIGTVLKDKLIGTCDVHVSNLISPAPSRLTRDVDYTHVGQLEESFKDQDFGQIILLVGMTCCNVVLEDLVQPGAAEIEVLGGNHTRLALQSLFDKGLLTSPIVKVNLYKALPRTEALAIGMQHNVILEEKKKPLSFVDKVKLMRECRPTEMMNVTEISSWKDMLCIIFRVECKRKLQQRMPHHLQMAQLPEEIFEKVLKVNSKKQVSEKFFRPMLRMNSNDAYHECLDDLLVNGQSSFKKKVAAFIEQGFVRSRKESTTQSAVMTECSDGDSACDEKENIETEELKKVITSLQEERNKLQKKLDLLQDYKRKRDSEDPTEPKQWTVGDSVRAKWRDDEFYEAKIQKIETVYHVLFTDDNKKRKVQGEELKHL